MNKNFIHHRDKRGTEYWNVDSIPLLSMGVIRYSWGYVGFHDRTKYFDNLDDAIRHEIECTRVMMHDLVYYEHTPNIRNRRQKTRGKWIAHKARPVARRRYYILIPNDWGQERVIKFINRIKRRETLRFKKLFS